MIRNTKYTKILEEAYNYLTWNYYDLMKRHNNLLADDTRKSDSNKDKNDKIRKLQDTVEKQRNEITSLLAKNEDLKRLVDTSESQICTKVRCCDMHEARNYAVVVGIRTNEVYEYYECKKCPVNKRSGENYWHITHKHAQKRGRNYGY